MLASLSLCPAPPNWHRSCRNLVHEISAQAPDGVVEQTPPTHLLQRHGVCLGVQPTFPEAEAAVVFRGRCGTWRGRETRSRRPGELKTPTQERGHHQRLQRCENFCPSSAGAAGATSSNRRRSSQGMVEVELRPNCETKYWAESARDLLGQSCFGALSQGLWHERMIVYASFVIVCRCLAMSVSNLKLPERGFHDLG